MAGVADALRSIQDPLPELQVYGYWNDNPSPPALDVYPATPFQVGAGFGIGESQVFLTVRARVGTADTEAAQQLLLRMLDPNDEASVEGALATAGAASIGADGGVNGFRQYADDVGEERLLGCEWLVTTWIGGRG
jgi:hypothetical protein